MNKKIHLSLATMGGNEFKYIQEAFETKWVAPLGPNVDAFENELEKYLAQNKYVAALSSGTAAMHLALIQLGVEKGDEVICQSLTFCASVNPISYVGATPVFIDSEPETWNMDPTLLEIAIRDRIAIKGKKPKAIIPVHLYGMPAQMDKILNIATRYDIPILEDAAEALGSAFNKIRCGNFGAFACLSFNGNKIITTSGGGALVCNDAESKKKTIFYATQARENERYYQHEEVGYNYRLSNISAGIGRGQMEVITKFVNRRREIHQYYADKLSDLRGVRFHEAPNNKFFSNYWLTIVQIDFNMYKDKNLENLFIHMENHQIECRPVWKPMHLQPVYKDCPYYGNGVSESIFQQSLCLPSGAGLTNEDLEIVVTSIREYLVDYNFL
jgi:dTDP-4-amino-4,6-dideoxygalactose transaminase